MLTWMWEDLEGQFRLYSKATVLDFLIMNVHYNFSTNTALSFLGGYAVICKYGRKNMSGKQWGGLCEDNGADGKQTGVTLEWVQRPKI